MKNTKMKLVYVMLFVSLLSFTACDEDEVLNTVILEEQTASDIPADPDGGHGPSSNFTFFDLETGTILQKADSNSNKWDLAFAGTTVLINGGISGPGQGTAQVVDGIFEDLETAPETGFAVDSEESLAIPAGSDNGWYTYTGGGGTPSYAILPIRGKVIMLTTGDGNYAKVEILSYYKGNPDTSTPEFADRSTRPAGRYYTFRYIVQENGSKNFK
ncbi:MAG: HmuY family protein [Candidatus Cyclobacteriaceae bacterium M2_1C_046]